MSKILFRTGQAEFRCDGVHHRCYPDDGGKSWIEKKCDCESRKGGEKNENKTTKET